MERNDLRLTSDADAFRMVETDYGTFTLTHAGDLRPVTVVLRFADGLESFRGDGLYCTAGYTIVIEAPGGGDIDGIPVWLPLLGRYGCWDGDGEQCLYLYPAGVSWEAIERDLLYYVSFRGDEASLFTAIWAYGDACVHFDFVPDDIMGTVESIGQMRAVDAMSSLQHFIVHYEPILSRHIFCAELCCAYAALIMAYKQMAQTCVEMHMGSMRSVALEVIGWYERCVPIIEQYQAQEMAPDPYFADIYLLLSFWCSDVGLFDKAFGYADRWVCYDASVRKAYMELRDMLLVKQRLGVDQFEERVGKEIEVS